MMGQAEKQQLFTEIRTIIRSEMKSTTTTTGGQEKVVDGSKGKEIKSSKGKKVEEGHHAGEGTPAGEVDKKSKGDQEISGEGTPAQGTGSKDEDDGIELGSSQDTKNEKADLKKEKDADGESLTTTTSTLSRTSTSSSCSSYDSDDEDAVAFPNPWAKLRYHLKEEMAEALGVFVFITFGNAVDCQVFLSQAINPAAPKGDYLSVAFGWGIGVGMGGELLEKE